jgi:L-lactate dehydrogenase (cytochrome)
MRAEIERDMKLMGVSRIDQLSRENIRFRAA